MGDDHDVALRRRLVERLADGALEGPDCVRARPRRPGSTSGCRDSRPPRRLATRSVRTPLPAKRNG
jgi:hypothetical protein